MFDMNKIPQFSPELLTEADCQTDGIIKSSTDAAHEVRIAFFEKCASRIERWLQNPDLTDEECVFYTELRRVFLYEDAVLTQFAIENVCVVMHFVFIEHMEECDVDPDICAAVEVALQELMLTENGDVTDSFEEILEACSGNEYIVMVFRACLELLKQVNDSDALDEVPELDERPAPPHVTLH